MGTVSAAAIEVEDLDPAGVLTRVADAERRDREVQREKLQLAYQWCILHPATSDSGAATWGDAGLPGLSEVRRLLGGDGSPAVAAFAAEELGAAMGGSTQSAMSLMADALDLRHRLPLLGAKVEALEVAALKTRRVAADTRSRPLEAARWVDEQLAPRVDGFGIPTIERLVALASARFAPEEQAEKEQTESRGWHVTLTHPGPGQFAGTSYLEALGIIAARQGALEFTDETPDGRQVTRRPVRTQLYVHVSLADFATRAVTGNQVIGEVEKLGPRHPRPHPGVAERFQGHDPTGAGPERHRHRGPPRPAPVDARADDPARRALRGSLVRQRRPADGPRPHHAVRRRWSTRPDQPDQSRAMVPATSQTPRPPGTGTTNAPTAAAMRGPRATPAATSSRLTAPSPSPTTESVPDAPVEGGRETDPGGVRHERGGRAAVHRRRPAHQNCVETVECRADRQVPGG